MPEEDKRLKKSEQTLAAKAKKKSVQKRQSNPKAEEQHRKDKDHPKMWLVTTKERKVILHQIASRTNKNSLEKTTTTSNSLLRTLRRKRLMVQS